MPSLRLRAQKGLQQLLLRQALMQVVTLAAGIALARLLGPAQFGVYAIVTFVVGVFALIGDCGLAPSLLQRKEELTEADLSTAFTLQTFIATFLFAAALLAAPRIGNWYGFDPTGMTWLIRCLGLNFFFSSWRSLSAIRLERELEYRALARTEFIETVVYQGTAIGLASLHFGVWALVVASLARGVFGTTLLYVAAPWPLKFSFDWAIARRLFAYGLHFQFQTVINQFSAWLAPTLVAAYLGPEAVGLLTWGYSQATKPFLLTVLVMRVGYAHLSRLQEDANQLIETTSRYLSLVLAVAGLWFAIILVGARDLIPLVFGSRWLPAVPAVIIYAFALAPDVSGWVGGLAVNASGRLRATTLMLLVRNVVGVALSIVLLLRFGILGVPVGYLVSSLLISPLVFLGLGPNGLARSFRPSAWVIPAALTSIGIGLLLASLPVAPLVRAPLALLAVSALYYLWAAFAAPAWLRWRVRRPLSALKGRLGEA